MRLAAGSRDRAAAAAVAPLCQGDSFEDRHSHKGFLGGRERALEVNTDGGPGKAVCAVLAATVRFWLTPDASVPRQAAACVFQF